MLEVFACVFIFSRMKEDEGQGKEDVTLKTMMSAKANERLKETLSMCHLGRTERKKYEGRS